MIKSSCIECRKVVRMMSDLDQILPKLKSFRLASAALRFASENRFRLRNIHVCHGRLFKPAEPEVESIRVTSLKYCHRGVIHLCVRHNVERVSIIFLRQ